MEPSLFFAVVIYTYLNFKRTGIIEKLDYIKALGVDAIWIQPVYRSPMVDMGYDPISMKEIDPLFGTMEDMENLIQAAHERSK